MKNTVLVDQQIARMQKMYTFFAADLVSAAEVLAVRKDLAAALGDDADLFFRIFARMMNRKRAATALPAALKMLRAHQVEALRAAAGAHAPSGPGTAFAGAAHA